VPKLATAVYEERAFDRLPILADALEDSGCDPADSFNRDLPATVSERLRLRHGGSPNPLRPAAHALTAPQGVSACGKGGGPSCRARPGEVLPEGTRR
jgi:hypothetical protein